MQSLHKPKHTVSILGIALLCIMLFGITVLAVPPFAYEPSGSATINGATAPDGTIVTAWINGVNYGGQFATVAGQWGLSVPGDDPDTAEREGGVAGDTVMFKLNGVAAPQTGIWTSGGQPTINLTVTVEGPTCNAAFSASPTSGVGPLDVQFTDQSTGAVTSRSWTFGDGATSTLKDPMHKYDEVAAVTKYTVSLTVNCGEMSDTKTEVQYITVNPITVTPDFSANKTSGSGPLPVEFKDKSTAQGCTISAWAWTFGDGGTSSVQSPSHTYAQVASTQRYDVSLKVTCGAKTATEMKEEYIQVNPPGTPPPPAEIPEPSTILLLVSGMAGLAGYARMRSRGK